MWCAGHRNSAAGVWALQTWRHNVERAAVRKNGHKCQKQAHQAGHAGIRYPVGHTIGTVFAVSTINIVCFGQRHAPDIETGVVHVSGYQAISQIVYAQHRSDSMGCRGVVQQRSVQRCRCAHMQLSVAQGCPLRSRSA